MKRWLSLVLGLTAVFFFLYPVQAVVVTPSGDDVYINEDTVINVSRSPYQINDTNGNGVLIINSSDITLDCNRSRFIGNDAEGGGIVISDRNNVSVKNCNISGYFYYAVKMENSSDSSLEDNVLFSTAKGAHIVNSERISLVNNSVIGVQNSVDGIRLLGSSDSYLVDNRVVNWYTGLLMNDSADTFIDNLTVNSSELVSISHSEGTVINNSRIDIDQFIDVLDTSDFLMENTQYPSLFRKFHVGVIIENTSQSPLPGVNVTFISTTEPFSESSQTGSDGRTGWILKQYQVSSGSRTNFTPYNITASKEGYQSNSTLVNVTESMRVQMTLKPVEIDESPPEINYSIERRRQLRGEPINISVVVADESGMNETWAVVALPNGSSETIALVNGGNTSYQTSIAGRYNITIFANDSFGNEANVTDYFLVEEGILFNVTVMNYNGSGLSSTLEVYFPHTSDRYKLVGTNGSIRNEEVLSGKFDLVFTGFDGNLEVKLEGVNLSRNRNRTLFLDRMVTPVTGFVETYGVESDYNFSSAEIRLGYNESELSDEGHVQVYRCSDWNLTDRKCEGNWSEINFQQNRTGDYVKVNVSSFSGFSIKQGPYCGDGICQGNETVDSCFEDCRCETGDNRSCGQTELGICEFGVQTCVDGEWGECVGYKGPENETCNRKDDDCDGTVDDVGNGDSVESTGCQCYNDGSPREEVCDGMDNDCDGEVDEDLTRECGNNKGICEYGTSTCRDGAWSKCEGGKTAEAREICDNGKDDNCNGQTDEGCENIGELCTNGKKDEGEEGVDCGGKCPNECPEFPWLLLVVIGVVLLGVAGYLIYRSKEEGKEKTWEDLEKKYTYR